MSIKNIHQMFERNSKNEILIDIYADEIEDIFNDYDNSSSFAKRLLKDDFIDYISGSVDEIQSQNFVIKINLGKEKRNPEAEEKLIKSIQNNFSYLKYLDQRKFKHLIYSSTIYSIIGILFISYAMILRNGANPLPLTYQVFGEGLTIAGWVALWQVISNIISEWMPIYGRIRNCNRILDSRIIFAYN